MNFSKVHSIQGNLLSGIVIDIEVDILKGLRAFSIVGLGDKSVEEAKDRIASAIKNSGFKSPKNKSEKVVISLAPADIKKNGTQFDVAMALAYLKAVGDIEFNLPCACFFGELSLDGTIRPITGILPLIRFAKSQGFCEAFVPKENAKEAALVGGIEIFGAKSLREIIDHIDEKSASSQTNSDATIAPTKIKPEKMTVWQYKKPAGLIDISEIKGQEHAKRGLLIAGAGRHNIALYGPPGTGKTMLGKAFAGILPPLKSEDTFDVTSIHSASGTLKETILTHPPLRSPHHTSSFTSIIGGGTGQPKAGEITLAHKGVLFLDEFPEFDRRIIEGLRQPLEDKEITITRTGGRFTFPADFILFATMNPCPCGFYGSNKKDCTCSAGAILNYQKKISGPIIDRIDIWIEVADVDYEKIFSSHVDSATPNDKGSDEKKSNREECSAAFQNKIMKAQQVGAKRQSKEIFIEKEIKEIIENASRKLNLSARSCKKVLSIARTIADLENSKEIHQEHILEALQYRPKVGF